jgi:pilus assembly protein CpaB
MFRRQSVIILGIAVLLGLVAVYLVNAYLSGADRQQEARAVQTTRIAVARLPLEYGTRITPQNVQFVEWPLDSVPQGAFRDIAELNPVGNTHVVLRPMLPGEPVLRSKLSGEGGRATISALLDPDMRAAAIRIGDVAGVAGFALPGDRVDVLLTRPVGEEQVTEILLHNIRLIAIDQNANDNADQPSLGTTATLEVTQEDAQKLVLGSAVGTLSLVLRSVQAPSEFVSYSNAMRSSDFAGGGYTPSPQQIVQAESAAQVAPRASRRAGPPPRRGINVEVVRGMASTDYEVRPYGGT